MNNIKCLTFRGWKGDTEAQYELGERYYNGWGVQEKDKKALKWYKRAARKGHVLAQYTLGIHYMVYDIKKSPLWLDLAAKQGLTDAKTMLGESFLILGNNAYFGANTEKNNEEALELYRLSAEQGNKRAKIMLENIGKSDSYRILAEQGDKEALYKVGLCYYFGIDTEKDKEESKKWLELSAEQGFADAQFLLGEYYYDNGLADTEDKKEAFKWYKLAAEQGCVEAQFRVGKCYNFGIGTDKNNEECIRWYTLAAENGHASAQFELGWLYKNSSEEKRNDKVALKWYSLAVEQGEYNAECELGRIYYEGDYEIGIKPDNKEGLRLIRLAKINGSGSAKGFLKKAYEYGID